ncbi:phosphotransferase [Streptomyces sp. NPDC002054]|uniref:phosphotransferase n=1 Tax=Streptomyces sp. NPDC002054 TaxID=3154663 RepID=UPI00332470A2
MGVPGQARRLGSSPRSRVWRVELARGPVVLKQSVGGADAGQRFAREVAALRLAGRRAPGVVPELLAVDTAAQVLVLEYLEHRRPGPDWIVGYAAALARLHAAGQCPQAGAAGVLPRWKGPGEQDVAAFLRLADRLGVPCPTGVPEELAGLVRRLAEAPGNALLHGDPCPGNDLHTDDGIRFVDFEQASLGSGLVELAYLRIGFPTCWCVTAAAGPLQARAEEAYRRVWRAETGVEVDAGGEGGSGLADACAGWLVRGDALVPRARREGPDQLARMVRRDWTWGTATARQRLAHRLGVVAGMTAGTPLLGATSLLCTTLRTRMLERWPALPPVPAERQETDD